MAPSEEQKREALKKVISSAGFEKSARARNLLEYLVTQDIMGKAAGLKGLVIAMDVFGKDHNFDAASDPLVRVHVGRLRELLTNYYSGDGSNDALRISIPVGRYQPEFITVEAEAVENQFASLTNRTSFPGLEKGLGNNKEIGTPISDEFDMVSDTPGQLGKASQQIPVSDFVSKNIKGFWLALLAMIGLLSMILYSLWVPNDAPQRIVEIDGELVRAGPITTSLFPKVRIFADLEVEGSANLASEVELGIANFDIIRSVIAAPIAELSEDNKKYSDLDFAIKIEAGAAGNNYSISAFALKNNELLLSRNIDTKDNRANAVAHFLMETAKPEGIIMGHLRSSGYSNELLECVWKNADYYLHRNAELFSKTIGCHKKLIDEGSKVGLAYAEHAGQIADAIGRKYKLPIEFATDREGYLYALKLAQKGADLSPYSARVLREVGFIHSKLGNLDQMNEWMEKAHKLNPLDTSVSASYGFAAVLVGKYTDAANVLVGAGEISVNHPTWWDYYAVLALIMMDDFKTAEQQVVSLSKRVSNKMYLLVRAIIANELDNKEELQVVMDQLKNLQPEFLASPDNEVRSKNFPEELKQRLLLGFEKAKNKPV